MRGGVLFRQYLNAADKQNFAANLNETDYYIFIIEFCKNNKAAIKPTIDKLAEKEKPEWFLNSFTSVILAAGFTISQLSEFNCLLFEKWNNVVNFLPY